MHECAFCRARSLQRLVVQSEQEEGNLLIAIEIDSTRAPADPGEPSSNLFRYFEDGHHDHGRA